MMAVTAIQRSEVSKKTEVILIEKIQYLQTRKHLGDELH